MKKTILLIFVIIFSLSLVFAEIKILNYETKFDKTTSNTIQNKISYEKVYFKKDYKKIYYGSRPEVEVDKYENQNFYKDKYRGKFNEYRKNRRETSSLSKTIPNIDSEAKYNIKKREETRRTIENREFKEKNSQKISLFKKYSKKFKSSQKYKNNNFN